MNRNSVLILGASSDVAKEIAATYAKKKYNLVLAGPNSETVKKIASDISIRYSVDCHPIKLDVLDTASHLNILNEIPEFPNTTICLVGYLGDHDKAKESWEEADRILNINFNGVVSVLNHIALRYESAKNGKIVVFSSVAGDRGRQSNYYYGSAKAALSAFLSGLRNRLQANGVQVVTVKPGFIDTKMTEGMDLPKVLTASAEQVAKRTVKAAERNRNVVYILWFWRFIMLIIKMIPEGIFKRLKL